MTGAAPVRVSLVASCYRAESHLPAFLDSVARQTAFDRTELVLVHNEPSAAELDLVRAFGDEHSGRLQHLVVDEVESWSLSMNHGIRAAQGEYVCIGNMDDIRSDDSLEREMDVLDAHPDVLVTYGDFIRISTPGSTEGEYAAMPEFDAEQFVRAYWCGPFPMWRRSVHERVGIFDEQLRSAGDFDLMARMALAGPMKHVGGSLGHYLDVGEGLSNKGDLPHVERTVVELRYGTFDLIDMRYLSAARKYVVPRLLQDGEWQDVAEFVEGYENRLRRRRPLWVRSYLRAGAKKVPGLRTVIRRMRRRST